MRAGASLPLALLAGIAFAQQPIAPLSDDAAWRFAGVPRQAPTRFSILEGGALRIEADASYGALVHRFAPAAVAASLAWEWRVDERNDRVDLTRRDGDDSALKLCALFDLPLERVPSFFERQRLRIARAFTGELLPAATVCYVWDAQLAQGTTLDNAFSRRVRYVVARGPEAPLAAWLAERHDIAADFRRLFGAESGFDVPPLAAIAIGADADNTRSRSVGFVRAPRWAPA